MAMVILNPTDDPVKVTWGGIDYVFEPDCRDRVEDSMGRQVIHNYGARGLVSLEYGDEGERETEKIKEGRRRWNEFWTKQCVMHNQNNEQRQQTQRPFVEPQPDVIKHAKRLGIKLIQPYRLEDSSSKQISMLMEQNEQLRKEIGKKDGALANLQSQVSDLTQNFKKLLSLAGEKKTEKVNPDDNGDDKIDLDSFRSTYSRMNKKTFINWVVRNWEEIQAYPELVKADLSEKHQALYNMPFPEDIPKLEQYEVV